MTKCFNAIPTLLWIIIGIAGISLFSTTCIHIHQTIKRMDGSPAVIRTYPYFSDIDKALENKHDTIPDRALMMMVWNNQKQINSDRDNLLADVRQETNNSIEKITAELNFWVAIIAILGVLVPIAITFKGERDNKGILKSYIDQSKENNKDYKENLNIRIRQWDDRVSEWDEKVKESIHEYDNLQDRFRQLECELKLEMNVNSMTAVKNNRLLEVNRNLRMSYYRFVEETINECMLRFDRMISDNTISTDNEKKWKLIKMSIQLFEIIRNLNLDYSGSVRPRYLNQGEDEIRKLLDDLMEPIMNIETVQAQFKSVRKHVSIILERLHES